ncbi:MAG: prepilin-type N-terminal cleavage/methylation domain-containing protein [Candidatus Doudnabacteria bacterium]|nr:prepilin-type N-terminal cleavage/methylation domain-containing protein [Candidatus Doudnabacteria bacterium]
MSNSQKGFTLIELVVMSLITALLAAVVTVNFRSIRHQQELQRGVNETISKIREVQNYVLTGQIRAGGEPAQAYVINFNTLATAYTVSYITPGATTTLEVVNLPVKTEIKQVYVNGSPRTSADVRFESPFGQITVGGAGNQVVLLDINHKILNFIRTIRIDGISGRIGQQ